MERAAERREPNIGEYLSIKEFSTSAGVSPQAIYQRLDKDLKPYLKDFKGKKSLNIQALELFSLKDTLKEFAQLDQLALKHENPVIEPILNSSDQDDLKELKNVDQPTVNQIDQSVYIDNLQAQIAYLQEELTKEREHSWLQAAQMMEITRNAQLLLAVKEQKRQRKRFKWWPFGQREGDEEY
jgi:DNA-binding protein Fis